MEDCIFCKIVSGEIPSTKVYEDDQVIVFKDLNPVAPVHDLVVPKKHYKNVMELDDKELLNHIFEVIKIVAKQENVAEDGFRIINNCGDFAGQTVKHIHFHVIGGEDLTKHVGMDHC
jgi:histidine triad (HIT) family protein